MSLLSTITKGKENRPPREFQTSYKCDDAG